MFDNFHEECGVFGVYGEDNAAYLTYLGIYALQHRGQESAGIASCLNGEISVHKGMGLISHVFKKYKFENLKGSIAIGHNRYSTSGSSSLSNAQPLCMECKQGLLSIAHNGNLINADTLHYQLQQLGAIFQTSSDSEIIVHLLSRSKEKTFLKALMRALEQVKGAYCLTAMYNDSLVAARDPNGFRPLCLGKTKNGYAVSSETCAFDLIGAEYVRDIKPGEIIVIKNNKIKSYFLKTKCKPSQCVFEFIYFSRPDSIIFGENCDKIRRKTGKILAHEDHVDDADIVISVPDSSNTAALGYAEESGVRFEIGLIRNHYIGRTFIKPVQSDRELSVKVKFNPVKGVIRNKKIILIEDSIVRGTTLKGLIKLLKSSGAKEIHVRVASPIITHPCYFGIDLSTKKELIGSNRSVEKIREFIGADSLKYLSLKGLREVVPGNANDFCMGCFSGKHPFKPTKNYSKMMLE